MYGKLHSDTGHQRKVPPFYQLPGVANAHRKHHGFGHIFEQSYHSAQPKSTRCSRSRAGALWENDGTVFGMVERFGIVFYGDKGIFGFGTID